MTQQKREYHFNGVTYRNKRDYNNAIAMSHLSETGQAKVTSLINKAIPKLKNVFECTEEQALKKINIGFKNSQQNKLNQDLQTTIQNLTQKGTVSVVIFNHVGRGAVVANGDVILYRKDFNDDGLNLLTEMVIVDEGSDNRPQEAEDKPRTTPARSLISSDIEKED